MLETAKQKIAPSVTHITTHHGPIETLRTTSFDLVLCAHVIEHCTDPTQALRDIFDRMTLGARIVLAISKPHWCTAIIRLIWRSKALKPDQVLAMLRIAGFADAHHHPFETGVPIARQCGVFRH